MQRTILTLLIITFTSLLFAQENAQWRGENRDGIYNETGLLKKWSETGPTLLWNFNELGSGHSSAAVTASKVYTSGTSGENGFVIAFDHSGKQLWKKEYGKEWLESWDGVRSTPMINNGKVYILSGYGIVYCMDANTGDAIWDVDLFKKYEGVNNKWGTTENLLIDDGKLFCSTGSPDANIVALDPNTGELIWKCKGAGEKNAYNSPMVISLPTRKVFVTMTEKHILGIDASNGTLLWQFEHPNKWFVHANTPLYHDGYLYCVSGYGKGGVMLKLSEDGSSITEVWRNETMDNRMGGVVLVDGKIYGSGSTNKKWFCLDWKTGKELYSSEMLKPGNIIYADGLLYLYDQGGIVAIVDPKTENYELISSFEVPYGSKQHWSHIVIHNKRLYVRHGESLMVYSLAAE